jgi:hypothetical protein
VTRSTGFLKKVYSRFQICSKITKEFMCLKMREFEELKTLHISIIKATEEDHSSALSHVGKNECGNVS